MRILYGTFPAAGDARRRQKVVEDALAVKEEKFTVLLVTHLGNNRLYVESEKEDLFISDGDFSEYIRNAVVQRRLDARRKENNAE